MSLALIVLVAALGSALTLISGFGLGTLLLPVFALFFPVEIAVGMTAVVHLLNNIFKFSLLYKGLNKKVFLLFGLPGIIGAFLGAQFLLMLGGIESFSWFGIESNPLEFTIGLLMIFFALTEFYPALLKFNFKAKYLVFGGVLSGFFGGLSGHQGALRSMFLIKANLSKEAYIATGVGIALLVDLTRIPVYASRYANTGLMAEWQTILFATLSAFLGAYVGKTLIPKITLRFVHILVGVLMILIGFALILNWL